MKTAKNAILGAIIVLLILFVAQNLPVLTKTETLRLNLLFTTVTTPPVMIALMLVICFATGYLLAFAMGFRKRRTFKKEVRNLEKQRIRTDQELSSLRNLPVTGDSPSREVAPPALPGPPSLEGK